MNLWDRVRSGISRSLYGKTSRAGKSDGAHQVMLSGEAFSDAIIDSLPGVFYVIDEGGHLIRWNKNSERATGYTAEELSRMPVSSLVAPEERGHLAAKMREAFTKGTAETEVHILSKNGELHPHFVTGIRAQVGSHPVLVGMGIDIGSQKRTETALREERNKSEAIIAAMGDGISVQDADFKIVYQNERHIGFVGSHVGEYCYRAYPREDAHCEDCPLAEVFRDGKVHVVERSGTDERGTRHYEISVSPLRDASGKIIGGVEAVRDITRRKQTEQALRESEEKFRALIESTSDWIWEIDEKRVYTYASPKVRDLLGYEPEEVLGRTPFDLMPPDEAARLRPQVDEIIAARGPFQRLENVNLHKDGRLVILETSGVPIFDKDGQWKGYRGIDRDITDRKSTERALEELNCTLQQQVELEVARSLEKDRMIMAQARQAAMGEMIGNIAHQWRQPLNVIGLIVQDLQDAEANGQLTPDYLQKSTRRAMDVIQHMSQTIDDFRGLYRTDKEKQPFSVNRILERVLTFVQASFQHHRIAIDAQLGEPVTIVGYPGEFSQVVLNLLLNARDVLVERAVPSPRVTIRLGRNDDRVLLIVADNGGGIEDSIRDRIFEPYFTTKEEGRGTGIGLYLSKSIIEKSMGGTLSARNTVDGAEFRIEL